MVSTLKKNLHLFPDFKCQMKENAEEERWVETCTHTRTCILERGKELCLCYKKMSASMMYSKVKQLFISSANITLSPLCKMKTSIYKCQHANFILELTCKTPATVYQSKGISSQEINWNVDKLIARLGGPDRDMTRVYLYCSCSDETHRSEIQRCFIF